MTFQEIIDLIVNNGMSVIIIGYMLFKDYKFNGLILDVLQEIKEVLAGMKGSEKEC